MVLNLFLALLLNSFNSEELKSKKEEVGDESRLARSFDRIRSIIRRRRRNRNEEGTKMEAVVNEVIRRKRTEKIKYVKQGQQLQPPSILYRRSYEVLVMEMSLSFHFILLRLSILFIFVSPKESLKRPISGSDFAYDIPLKDRSNPHNENSLYDHETIAERLNEIQQGNTNPNE